MNATLENLIENPNRIEFQPIADLYEWSLNYNFPTPYSLLLDLIGYSEEEFGSRLAPNGVTLGYLEMSYLGEALKVIGDYGQDAMVYAVNIAEAELKEAE